MSFWSMQPVKIEYPTPSQIAIVRLSDAYLTDFRWRIIIIFRSPNPSQLAQLQHYYGERLHLPVTPFNAQNVPRNLQHSD